MKFAEIVAQYSVLRMQNDIDKATILMHELVSDHLDASVELVLLMETNNSIRYLLREALTNESIHTNYVDFCRMLDKAIYKLIQKTMPEYSPVPSPEELKVFMDKNTVDN